MSSSGSARLLAGVSSRSMRPMPDLPALTRTHTHARAPTRSGTPAGPADADAAIDEEGSSLYDSLAREISESTGALPRSSAEDMATAREIREGRESRGAPTLSRPASAASSSQLQRDASARSARLVTVPSFTAVRVSEEAPPAEEESSGSAPGGLLGWLLGTVAEDQPAEDIVAALPRVEPDAGRVAAALDTEPLRAYAEEFEHAAAAEEITVGLVPEEVLAQREAALEAARLKEEEETAKKFAAREALLAAKEEAARERVLAEKADLADRIRRREAQTAEVAEARTSALHRVFRRAEVTLKSSLAAQHAVVSERYGRLLPGRAGARLLRIEWHKLPQPVELRVHKLRAVKNKLPAGRYVMLVTLYDRLGGNPLRWSRIPLSGGGGDASRPGATTPVRHRGRFYDTEMVFNQCIYAVAPSQVDLRPSHVFILELFLLGGRSNPIDRVVAWTALPACDRDFQVVWGRFKLPLLRGELDMAVDKYRTIESMYGKDLDTWLANIYLEVVHLPRETTKDGVTTREFDVEVAYTSELLRIRGEHRLPKRWDVDAPNRDGLRKRRGNAQEEEDMEAAAAAEAAEAEDLTDSDSDSEASSNDDELADDDSSSLHDDDAEWDADGQLEENDYLAGGPQIVTDGVTREDVVALGPVDTTPGASIAARNRRASKLRAAIAMSQFTQRARNSITEGRPEVEVPTTTRSGAATLDEQARTPARPSSRAAAARAKADYWRARAAKGGAAAMPTPGAGVQADGGEDSITERTPLQASTTRALDAFMARRRSSATAAATAGGRDTVRAGASTLASARTGAAGAPSTGRAGSVFAAEAARGRNLFGRAAAALQMRAADVLNTRLGLARKPMAGGMTSTQIRATMPGQANVAERGRALGAGTGLSSFTYAVNKQEGKGLRGARIRESIRKLRFLQHEIVADLHPGGVLTFEFWIQAVIALIALWLRIYVHYLGQYLFLRSLRVPVYELRPLPYSATLKYVPDVLPNEVEIGVVLLGPLSVITIFGCFAAFSWICQRLLGYFPEVPSRFVAFFGVGSVLDPLLILLIDAMAGRYDCAGRFAACAANIAAPSCQCSEGDAFKLYRRFVREEGSGVVGIVLTVFMYLVIMLLAVFLLYAFMLHLHLNGRMIDLFRRLHAPEDKFNLPNDFEVSPADIQWIVARAGRWRGPRGSSRKVAVCDYVLTDPLDPNFKETTTHLIIYHATLDGKRELYRHFLRLPDGCVLEVFGSMETSLGVASGLGTAALQSLLMTHAKERKDDEAGMSAFFEGL